MKGLPTFKSTLEPVTRRVQERPGHHATKGDIVRIGNNLRNGISNIFSEMNVNRYMKMFRLTYTEGRVAGEFEKRKYLLYAHI